MGLVKREELLATTGRGNRRWNGGQLEVAQDAGHHRLLGDGGNDAPGSRGGKTEGRKAPSAHTVAEDRLPYPDQTRDPAG